MKNKDMQSQEPATAIKSSLCRDKQCQSTRCFKKFTRSDNVQSPVRPKYTDDKNCQFMQPVKLRSVVQLAKPAVYEDTRIFTYIKENSLLVVDSTQKATQ